MYTVAGWLAAILLMLVVMSSPGLAQKAQPGNPAASSPHDAHHPPLGPNLTPQVTPALPVLRWSPPSGTPSNLPDWMSMPGTAPVAPPALATEGPAPGAGMMGMGMMRGRSLETFPRMMGLPAGTNADEAQRLAFDRMQDGASSLVLAGQQLQSALSTGNWLALQASIEQLREALSKLESGVNAQRMLAEGAQPQAVASKWFKTQTALGTQQHPDPAAPFGLSWRHFSAMALLIVAASLAFVLYALRLQWASSFATQLAKLGVGASRKLSGLGIGGASPKPPAAAVPATPAKTPTPAPPLASTGASKKPSSHVLCVTAIFLETPTVKTFRLMERGRDAISFTFLPGQYLTLTADIKGKRVRRSYTIASAPTQRDYVEITVKREDHGAESRQLHDHVTTGDLIEVSGPLGAFTFTGNKSESIVLIAGGVGITPMMSVIRYLTDRSYPGDIFFLYGARAIEHFIFREELEYLQSRHPNLHVFATMSQSDGVSWTGATGPISKEFIAKSVPHIVRLRVHLCGPIPMMQAVKAALDELDVPKAQIKTEAFGPAQGMLPASDDKEPDLLAKDTASPSAAAAPNGPDAPAADPTADASTPATDASPPAAPPLDASSAAATRPDASSAEAGSEQPLASPGVAPVSDKAQVQFAKSGKSGALAPDQPVLEAAEAIGVVIDFECRVGTCGRCKVPLLQGAVTMEVEEALGADEKAKGIILACQAKSSGDIVVDA